MRSIFARGGAGSPPYILIFILTVALVADALMLVRYWPHGYSIDYGVFWRAVRGEAYTGGTLPFVYPPTTLLWLSPLKLVPFWPGYAAWIVASVALFNLTARRLWEANAVNFAMIAPVVWLAILPGQLTLFTCAMIVMAYSTRHRGLWLALAVTLKPQLALLAPLFLLIERDFRQLAVMTAVAALIAALATLVFGFSIWATWLHSIPTLKPALDLRGITPVVLSPAVLYGLPAVPVFIVATIFGAVVAYLARVRSPQLRLQAMCATSLLAAPYSLKYELAIFAPAMAAYILRQNWKSLVACLPFSGTLGPPSLLIAILQLVDERIPSSTPADNPAQSRDERPC